MKRLLLHICCGPCAIYPFSDLVKAGFEVEGFFYNPNIQPESEHLKREKATKDFEKIFNAKVHFSGYQKKEYLDCIRETKDKTSRCRSCFKLRLKATHQFALENKFNFLRQRCWLALIKIKKTIEQIGDNVSKGSKTQFLFRDFRPGFRQAHTKAKELNLYCQKYCGCLSSLEERNR